MRCSDNLYAQLTRPSCLNIHMQRYTAVAEPACTTQQPPAVGTVQPVYIVFMVPDTAGLDRDGQSASTVRTLRSEVDALGSMTGTVGVLQESVGLRGSRCCRPCAQAAPTDFPFVLPTPVGTAPRVTLLNGVKA